MYVIIALKKEIKNYGKGKDYCCCCFTVIIIMINLCEREKMAYVHKDNRKETQWPK